MNKTGIIEAISISSKKGVPKKNISSALLIEDHGIEHDAHAGKWHRQISFLAKESIDKMRGAGLPNLRNGAFAENITTSGIIVKELKIGDRLKVGNDAEVEITQIGKVCHTKCAIFYTVGTCVMPDEGVFGRVIKQGTINVNDKIKLL